MPERARYGPADLDPRRTAFAGVLVAVGILVAATIAWITQSALHARELGADRAPHPVAVEPHLQTDAVAERQAFEGEKMARLSSYGWVDRAGGRVHVPIEQAMRELAGQHQ